MSRLTEFIMRTLVKNQKGVISILMTILIVLVMNSTSDADVTSVSQRTPQVRDAIVAAVPGVNNAADVTEAHLAAITSLNLRGKGISGLKTSDFSGLTALTSLNLYNNQLSSLPDGIFEVLTSLTTIRLGSNLVDPLPLTVSLEKVGTNQFKAVAPTGATFDYILPISVENGSITGGTTQLIIPSGSVESNVLTVIRTPGTNGHVTVNIGILPNLPRNHYGYALVKSDNLPLVIIRGINIVPVFSDGITTTRSVAENTASGVNIGAPVSATNVDNDTLTYTLSGIDAASFGIDRTTGQIKTKAALDYETKIFYLVTVAVSDGYGGSDSIIVTINVTDVHENRAPIFTDGTRTARSIAENTASGQNIGTAITATDVDKDTLTYTLSGTDAAAFSIDSKTGQIKTKTALDYETKNSYNVTLTVSDGLATDIIVVTINVTDVYENRAPVFTEGESTTRTIAENTARGVNIGDAVAATDPNAKDTLTYTLGGTDAASFNINSNTGRIKTKTALDYETKNSYNVTLTVSDGLATDIIVVTINVTDVHENRAPVFTEGNSATRTVAENTTAGTNIGNALTATDPDNDTLIYSLGGQDASAFGIDTTTGQLRTNAALDYETKSIYVVSVTVSDGKLTTTIAVTINITDVDELPNQVTEVKGVSANNAPVFTEGSSTSRSVAENTGSGVDIGRAVSATDADGHTLTYSLGGTDAAAFTINSTTGQLRTHIALDRETQSSYTVTIAASDGTDKATITVTINVVDETENRAPVFTDGSSTSRSVAENTGSGVDIGRAVSATDADGHTLTYSLGGTDAAAFTINSTTGQLRTHTALDYETKSIYTVSVTVSDGKLTTTIAVTINITDVDESPNQVTGVKGVSANNAPVFTAGSNTSRSIAENTGSGVDIGSAVSATDPDNDTLTYSLGGTDAAAFTINSTTGQLRTHTALDYETQSSYTVTITASDGTDEATITVTINVIDETENRAPVFTDGSSTSRSVAENTGSGVDIGSAVSATDADGDTLTYSLDGTDDAAFTINSITGQLRTHTALDHETQSSYTVIITASDGTDEATITVIINVIDETENRAPVFTDGSSTSRSVAENTGSGVDIGNPISATDAEGNTLTYFLSGTDAKAFSIDTTTGQLRTNAALDYETKSSYSVTVTVSDGNLTSTITVIINVSDIDEPSQTDVDPPQTNLSEDVWMPDVHLRFAVRTALDIGSEALTQTKMLELTSLTAQNALISNLKGLEYAKNLTHLDVASNQITSISVLQGLTKLVHINIEDNQVTDISVLTNLTKLQYIYVAGNPITDLSPMGNRPLLGASWPVVKSENSPEVRIFDANLAAAIRKALSIEDDASITEADMEQLISLTATNAQIDSLSGLQYATNLTALDLSNNEIWSVSQITGLRKLTHLNLSHNKIDFVYGLHWIVSLKELKLAGNPIDIKDAASLLVLKNLSVAIDIKLPTLVNVPDRALARILRSTLSIPIGVPITKEALQTMTSLGNNYIREGYKQGYGKIKDLTGLEHATAMTTLSLPYHGMSNITALQSLTQLTSLDLSNNYEISSYTPLSSLTNLTSLNLVNTYISDISSLSGLTKLTELNIGVDFFGSPWGESELSDISSLANLTKLTSLILSETEVSDISHLSGLTKLTFLSLRETEVSDISHLSGLTKLTNLSLDNTKVRSISTLSKLTQLGSLYLSGNKIVDISPLTGLTNLGYLTLNGNPIVNTLPLCPLLRANGGNLFYVDIEVTNCPPPANNAPVFTEGTSATRSVAENTASGTHIGTVVSATDADTDDTLTYSLGGTDAATFEIDATDGQLKTKAPLDYETKSTYTVTVSVSDGNSGSDSIDVTINVTDVDETSANNAPVFTDGTSTTRSVAENTASGQNIGAAISATDADSSNTLTYSLSGTDASSFSIVSTSGQLQTSAALDYETKTSYSVTVSVSDGNGGSDSISVTINVTDVSETNSAPTFTDGTSTTRSVAEGTAASQNIGTAVGATDADSGDTLTYTLSGTDASSFSIVSTSGQLQTSASLDYETKNAYSVTVSVSDGNSGTDSIDVTINVTDVDEAGNDPPTFTDGTSTTRSVAENTTSGSNIGTAVAATDSDNGDTLTYTLGGTDSASFSIVSTSGQLQTNAALDYETKTSYSVTVSVSDGNGGSDSITVTINVTDVNETAATVSTNITTCSVSHKSGNVYDVTIAGTVTGNRNVRFLIVHGYVNDDPDEIGRDSVGFLDAGETKNFSITGTWTHDGSDGSISQDCSVVLTYQILSAPSVQSLPVKTALLPNYPNPFNPETWIPFQLAKPSEVTITIYDVRGRVVRVLNLGHQAAGMYTSRSRAIHWDGRNHFGEKVAAGVYFYMLKAGDFSATRKMLIRK